MKKKQNRLILPNLAELIDSLTVYQIKEVLLPKNHQVYADHIKQITHDIDLIIKENPLKLSAAFIRLIAVLAQINLHIWHGKDKMRTAQPNEYVESLKLAHQLNGLRNKIKNKLLDEFGIDNVGEKHTNVEIDDLKDWKISIE